MYKSNKFGTFGGVFTPSLLTILGVIMFLRFNTVVGYAGLWGTLIILVAAKTISMITGMSIASVSTNMRVKGGGAYFLISRSLGPEFGGVIAVFFFIAQAVAVTMYVVGFTEAVFSAFPEMGFSQREFSTIINILVFISVYIGAGWTIKLQYGILAVLMLSIISFFIGSGLNLSLETFTSNLKPQWTSEFNLFTTFALFFPAVTGIMAGVNMSGDLKEPSHSIPKGTFLAISFSGIIYLSIALLLAGSISRSDLLSDKFVMKDIAILPFLIYAGVFSATLSSALGSMMGAPRILQSFAKDKVFRKLRWFGVGSGSLNEPRRATVITFLIAQTGIFAGDLNTIAPVITMFFLLTYGTMNLACFYEGLSKNPSFRPTYKLNHWAISLFGAAGCLAVMFLINAVWAAVALILAGVLYYIISRSEVKVKWGDVTSGLAYQRARKSLLKLENEKYHPKNWRPSILVLSGGAYNRLHLSDYGYWFTAGSGILSIGQIIPGELKDLIDRRREAEKILRKFIFKQELSAFPAVLVKEDIHTAVQVLLQTYGIGGLRPNTVLLGWSKVNDRQSIFYKTVQIVLEMERSLIVVACEQEQEKTVAPEGTINIWWQNELNGELMLLLAHLLKTNTEWNRHELRILRPVPVKADMNNIKKEMKTILVNSRIDAELLILPTEDPLEAVSKAMQPSAVLFAGFDQPEENETQNPFSELQKIIDLPGDVILVHNSGDASIKA